MKKSNIKSLISYSKHSFLGLFATISLYSCTKIGNGYIAPEMLYLTNTFTIQQGFVASSYGLNANGTSTPYRVKWTHIYDSVGNIVDTLFTKTYPIQVWTAAYNPKTDTTNALMEAKIAPAYYPAITLDSTSGIFTSTPASFYLPLGPYAVDIQVTNAEGTVNLPKAMYFNVQSGVPLQTAPQISTYAVGRAKTGTAPVTYDYNGTNNPFVKQTVIRSADSPNIFTLKFIDKNGVPFNPNNEIIVRPQTGLNPVPPYLQNLKLFSPDTYQASDTAMSIKFPIVPFPVAGNLTPSSGYNLYYNISTNFVNIDSTSSWSSNAAGNYYQGIHDSHYKGQYTLGEYDYVVRVPLRIFVPGTYELIVQLLNVSHR